MIVGITANGEVSGVKIVSHAETAGLGALAAKDEFLAQYKGGDGFTVVKGESAQGEISAISGATVTSKAVTLGVNIALAEYSGRSFEQ
jgi:electron transport complex protein RnfG